jgi:hypothetical protein
MGRARDPWFLEAAAFEPNAYGAFPEYEFDHQRRPFEGKRKAFTIPDLSLPQGVDGARFGGRLDVLRHLDAQRQALDTAAGAGAFDRFRADAVSLLTDARVRAAFDLNRASPRDLDRYGRNAFGWSLLTAARLVEAGVNLVQVNLGNNESWDTHGNAFPHLKDKLLPPTDKALAALLADLGQRGQLDETLVVMAGEFGRTPRISTLPQFYKGPGRDHWGAVQSVWLAGGGVRGGRAVGSSDKTGGYPATDPQTPENFAATIYSALGLPKTAAWADAEGRPHHLYRADPMPVGLRRRGDRARVRVLGGRCRERRQTSGSPPARKTGHFRSAIIEHARCVTIPVWPRDLESRTSDTTYFTASTFASAVTGPFSVATVARSTSGTLNGPASGANVSTNSPSGVSAATTAFGAVTPLTWSGSTSSTVAGPARVLLRLTLTASFTSPSARMLVFPALRPSRPGPTTTIICWFGSVELKLTVCSRPSTGSVTVALAITHTRQVRPSSIHGGRSAGYSNAVSPFSRVRTGPVTPCRCRAWRSARRTRIGPSNPPRSIRYLRR